MYQYQHWNLGMLLVLYIYIYIYDFTQEDFGLEQAAATQHGKDDAP